MNMKLTGLALLIPTGAILFTACGPTEDMASSELALDQASDQFAFPKIPCSEYGLCNDGWDNDGNGLVDMADPACHLLGPLRDLSLFPAPIGHNFVPDPRKIPIGGPGYGGGFRDPIQIANWMRFLTDYNGITAGIDLLGAALDSPVVPVPVPLWPKVRLGTAHQGNNNNILLAPVLPPPVGPIGPGAAFGPVVWP